VVVVGNSGAGKTTLGRRLASSVGVPFVETDALFHGPGWTERPTFAADVTALVAEPAWVVDLGGYPTVLDLVWDRAEAVVWLDLSRVWVATRVVGRSTARAIDHRPLWNGNTEGFRDWARADHPIRRSWEQHTRRRAEIAARLRDPRWAGRPYVHLRTPGQARRWLSAVQVRGLVAPDGSAGSVANAGHHEGAGEQPAAKG
jgi:adenylate kinase family enzyme